MSVPAAAFYFDLSSPLAYLAAERVLHVLPGPAEWQPMLARELPGGESHTAFRCAEESDVFRAELERRALELELQPMRWPDPFPFDSTLAMRVATYAKSIGRVVPFVQAAFRQAFAAGRSLQDPNYVLIAAAACEMHPTAVLRGAELRSVADQLRITTASAAEAGVNEVPAVWVAGTAAGEPAQVFLGERALEHAGWHMAGSAHPGGSAHSGDTGGSARSGSAAL